MKRRCSFSFFSIICLLMTDSIERESTDEGHGKRVDIWKYKSKEIE